MTLGGANVWTNFSYGYRNESPSGFRFRLQDRFTTASRQSPHVEKESDQST